VKQLERLRKTTLAGAVVSAMALAGCTVGPDYKRPEMTTPEQFRSQITTAEAQSMADLPWWGMYQDPALQGLIAHALDANQDLKLAVARIEQARALVGVSKSQSAPQVGYEASAGGERAVVTQVNGKPAATTFGSITGLLNAAWELDIWGRIRRSNEAAEANLFASEDVRRGVMLTLVSDLAADYFQLLELDRELAIAEESQRVYRKTLDLFTDRFKAGKDSELPVARTQAAYDFSTAQIHDLKRQIGVQENAISVLAGDYPRAIERGRPLTEQSVPQAPVSATTVLLERRPDIRAAEHNMVAANAGIGEAIADYFPRVGLSALAGGDGIGTGGNFSGFGVWQAAISAAGPLLTGGRLGSVKKQREAIWDETVASYKKTIQVAFQETSDALIAQQTLVGRRTALESQVRASQQSIDLALDRYHAGRSSYFEVLEAEQQLFPAQDELARTQRDQLLAGVSLYKALGGGWHQTDAEWAHPQRQ
jgi:multidrug efflux system outer membrane protein